MRIRSLGALTFLLAVLAVPAMAAPRAMVVTAQHLATDAGWEILKAGGNIGGGGFMLLRLRGRDIFLDFRETAPAAATEGIYLDAAPAFNSWEITIW